MSLKRAVFLDRDGTVNEQMGYINHLDRLVLLPGVGRAIRRLNHSGLAVVVVSNQSGVARGYFPNSLVNQVNREMRHRLAQTGAELDGIYYCPHHPRAEVEEYRQSCNCRKPGSGLFEKAAAELQLDLSRSYVVGDRSSDIKAGRNIGAKSILVLTGYGKGERDHVLPSLDYGPDHVAEDLEGAADWIIEDASKG